MIRYYLASTYGLIYFKTMLLIRIMHHPKSIYLVFRKFCQRWLNSNFRHKDRNRPSRLELLIPRTISRLSNKTLTQWPNVPRTRKMLLPQLRKETASLMFPLRIVLSTVRDLASEAPGLELSHSSVLTWMLRLQSSRSRFMKLKRRKGPTRISFRKFSLRLLRQELVRKANVKSKKHSRDSSSSERSSSLV